MKCRLIRDLRLAPSAEPIGEFETVLGMRIYRAGTVLEGPKVDLIVQCGNAVPEDDECREACGLTAEQLEGRIEWSDNLHGEGNDGDDDSTESEGPADNAD